MSNKIEGNFKLFKKNKELFLLTLPGMIFVIIFSYVPMAGIIVAFKDYKLGESMFTSEWVGLYNFSFLFDNKDLVIRLIRNTILENLLFIITGLIVALILALILNEVSKNLVKTYQTILFFPTFISWVIASYILLALLDMDKGYLNNILVYFGREPILWYNEPKYWPVILMLANIWKYAGYNAIIYYTAILGVNPELYEAAELDGAGKWRQIISITLPSISNVVIIMLLLSIGKICYADFGMFFQLTRDSTILYPTTDVIDTYVYRALRKTGDIGMSAAAGILQSFIGFILVLLSNYLVKRRDEEQALF